MSCARYLKEMLAPLRVYRLEGTLNGAELESIGMALDGPAGALEELEREMLLTTAESWGLDQIESLLRRRPVAQTPQDRREALAALLRIGGDSFTLAAINDNLRGCGVNAVVSETDTPGTVEVRFPDVPGIPDGFDEIREILEDILPCHLLIRYVYWYITWKMLEERFSCWGEIEAMGLSWGELEKLVKEEI
ncbi:DUF2313 domain-containing protein [Pseudoflavonifractor sp. DSM 107456]|uniref:DUF2313 domain-containing protein n=1 Tax=Pseudoflavonifractor gallinarum TaxID=2779352 RepID=A0ABR9RDK1_9FIRM|nr:DUF2313 domain-containing protein [Pseudoflavonifractor gallinarum]MBE5056729.1 DUF2313 domain-containing protein [Pseudoflavonifractor gallinarum]